MDERQRHYLEVMGIQTWSLRDAPQHGPDEPVVRSVEEEPKETVTTESEPPLQEPSLQEPPLQEPPLQEPPLQEPPEWLQEPDYPELEADSYSEAAVVQDGVEGLDWAGLQERVAACSACEELAAARTQTVFGVGNRQADWLIIGEAPGADEDRQGEPFVGRAGQLLNAMLGGLGLKREQVYIANILKCRPPNNRDPKPEEAAACSAYLQRQIALLQPRVILAVGRIAAQNLLNSDAPIGKLRGRVHRHDSGVPLVVTYHPAYLLRSPLEKRKSWADLCLARTTLRQTQQEGE